MLADPAAPAYEYGPTRGDLVRLVADPSVAYAKQLVAVTNLIHAKSAGNVKGVAGAFRFRGGEVMAGVVYLLCSVTALGCALLPLRNYRRSGLRLLLWSGGCFLCLAINNALVFVDLVLVPDVDLVLWRNLIAAAGISFLLYGLIWDSGR